MRRIKRAGKGFVKVDGQLINLKDYKSVGPVAVGMYEIPGERTMFAIGFTPSVPSRKDDEDNFDGTWNVMYKEAEKRDFEADCKVVVNATSDSLIGKVNMFVVIPIVVGLIVGLIILAIEYKWFALANP